MLPLRVSASKFKLVCISLIVSCTAAFAQGGGQLKWAPNGDAYLKNESSTIVSYTAKDNQRTVLVPSEKLTPQGSNRPLPIRDFSTNADQSKWLLYTNTKKVWRYDTRGDYWVYDSKSGALKQLGASLPASSLMFAKLSPDGTKAAYVSQSNVYVEDLATNAITPLTKDGTRRFINGTFDWVYEEEFGCRDGFRWSPDSKSIAFWQIDATKTRDFLMINNTDSIYSFTIPVEYPKAGENPSACRIGIVNIASTQINWLQVPGDQQQNYIPRMEWIPGTNNIILQQLNRKQNNSKLYVCDATNGNANQIYEESDSAWIDVKSRWDNDQIAGWDFIEKGNAFVWVSEKDGWRHVYRVGIDGKKEKLLTPGNYDVINVLNIDEANKSLYVLASPDNATQQYLYRVNMTNGKAERISPADQAGTHNYQISPNGKYARHTFSNHYFVPTAEIISLPNHLSLNNKNISADLKKAAEKGTGAEFFQVTTEDGVTLDGWMNKPANFDESKQYPVVFYVYGEPASCTVTDVYGSTMNFLYGGDMAKDGYITISLDNRGTPAPKGRAWRKSIYRNQGIINARDQAMATKKIMEWKFVDKDRIAVWGWSGGGSMTLNLLFQYPEIYKTGISIAAVGNLLTYDNIYQERYMGLPQETKADYVKGSPITYAKNLKGNLLYIHGTGDDNVHYANAEMLVNELIKYGKIFQFMPYPNRTHSISEGQGTSQHLSKLYTTYLREHVPGGPKK
ncbi:dipeptidyl-peptidase-4 [Chitinophaga skermanii]|uniref:Dipeptidyl-peptidase-4 n=1 Tax=Chitinophaga skermanii TaxID=331697 RepID=A0A327QQ24_9BACT|nr:DPP IV N-terminal domain-containing protein [Chitinophaga skermanii]RAJ06679.1 dipeptidyl-peptidase-4 [Chitinophaga skermanii]